MKIIKKKNDKLCLKNENLKFKLKTNKFGPKPWSKKYQINLDFVQGLD